MTRYPDRGFPLEWVPELDPPRWVCHQCFHEFFALDQEKTGGDVSEKS
jgi:hypothetical protein